LAGFSWLGSNEIGEQVMQRRSCLAFSAIVLATVLCPGCSSNPGATAKAAAPPPAGVPSAQVAPLRPAQPDYIASGPLVVEHQLDLCAQRDGIVAQILVATGTPVRKGELLAKLDDRQITADRDAAAARAKSSEADLKNWEAGAMVAHADRDRSEALWKAHIIAKQLEEKAGYQSDAYDFEVDRQREDAKNAEETLKALQLELDKTRIVAPFDGVVARRYVRVGQQVAKNDRLFWISALAPLRVNFTLPENYLERVHKGTQLVVIPAAAENEVYSAKVVVVSPVVDPSSDTIDVTAELDRPYGDLRPGMTVNIRLQNPR
jgi:RND family efflux transporter MFP subunit